MNNGGLFSSKPEEIHKAFWERMQHHILIRYYIRIKLYKLERCIASNYFFLWILNFILTYNVTKGIGYTKRFSKHIRLKANCIYVMTGHISPLAVVDNKNIGWNFN